MASSSSGELKVPKKNATPATSVRGESYCKPKVTALPCYEDAGSATTSIYEKTLQSILSSSRLDALKSSDVPPVPYNTYSFFSYILSFHGRNFSMLVAPLILLLLWGIGWWLIFFHGWIDMDGTFQAYMASQTSLVDPLITPLSFLMTFRLGRAAIRWWEVSKYAVCLQHLLFLCAYHTLHGRLAHHLGRSWPSVGVILQWYLLHCCTTEDENSEMKLITIRTDMKRQMSSCANMRVGWQYTPSQSNIFCDQQLGQVGKGQTDSIIYGLRLAHCFRMKSLRLS